MKALLPIGTRLGVVIVLLGVLPTALWAQEQWPNLTPAQVLAAEQSEESPQPAEPPATLEFGFALAARGGTLLVGMPGYPGGYPDYFRGRVAVFVESDSGGWVRSATLQPQLSIADDRFGEHVALGHHLALVGAGSGVYVFRKAGASWAQVQKLVANASQPLNGGEAISAGMLLIGSVMRGQPGAVGVYRKGGKGSWSLVQTLTSGEDMADDSFGTQLAVSHGALVVGAAGADGGRGAAFIFRRAGAHWVAWQKLTRVDGESGDAFGTAVDIASRRIAVGAPGALLDPQGLCGPPSGAGEVDVFEPLGGQWMQTQTISTPIANCTLGFGVNVAVGGGHLVGVTPSSYPYTTGAAFVYARGNAGLAPQGMAPDGEAVNNLVVELDRSTLFVGLPLDEEYATGYVEVFALGNAEGDSEAAAADH